MDATKVGQIAGDNDQRQRTKRLRLSICNETIVCDVIGIRVVIIKNDDIKRLLR
jgi:hypothetical protein